MTSFLQTWTDGAVDARERAGDPLIHAASNQYGRMGVVPGDALYVAYLDDRQLHLLGRLVVDRILTQTEAEQLFGPDIWVAEFHAIGAGTNVALFDVRVSDAALRSLSFVRRDGKTTRLDVGGDGSVNGQALQAIRRLVPGSAALLDEILDGSDAKDRSGWSGSTDPLVEQRAMAVVRQHYESEGWAVEDVSSHRPYDFVCSRGDDQLHVEVKGLSGPPTRIHLTANEVEHARTCPQTVLSVVSGIKRSPTKAAGGTLRLFAPWELEDGRLRATAYSYALS